MSSNPPCPSLLQCRACMPRLHSTCDRYTFWSRPGLIMTSVTATPACHFRFLPLSPFSSERGRLRLAESIIHECMHLQLTITEDVLPLVETPEVRLFSPWRQSLRPVTGVLHGFYVFAVVYEFFRVLSLTGSLTSDESDFVSMRRRQIVEEAAQVASLASAEGLTDDGQCLVRYLNRCFDL